MQQVVDLGVSAGNEAAGGHARGHAKQAKRAGQGSSRQKVTFKKSSSGRIKSDRRIIECRQCLEIMLRSDDKELDTIVLVLAVPQQHCGEDLSPR